MVVRRLHDRLLDDEAVLERFRLEALAAARLNHGHVANLFDVTVRDGLAYTVGEYVDGPSLTRLMQDGPLDPVVVAAIGHQAGLGLAAAHEAGIVHRDMRPGNLLIGRDGRVRIVDFGSARIPDPEHDRYDDGQTRAEVYLAPEQLDSGVVGTDRSDVYALGRTLLRALEGYGPPGPDVTGPDVADLGSPDRASSGDGDDDPAVGPDDANGGERLIGRLMAAIPGLPLGASRHDELREQLAAATHPDPERRPTASELAASLRTFYDRRADEVLRRLVSELPATEFGRRLVER